MSYSTLFHPKKILYVEFMRRYQFVLKISILFKKLYLYILTFLKKSKYLNVLYPQHVYFDLSKIKDFKTHKQKK